jgi:hypothetical protein
VPSIPSRRPTERDCVEPDVKVLAEEALETAKKLASEQLKKN